MIPLRPLALGDLLNGAVGIVGRYWSALIGFALSALGVLLLGLLVLGGAVYAVIAQSGVLAAIHSGGSARPSGSQVAALLIGFGMALVGLVVAGLLMLSAFQAACPVVVSEAVLGRPITLRETWRRTRARLMAVLGVQALTGLVVVPVFLLMAGVAVLVASSAAKSPAAVLAVIPLFLLAFPVALYLQIRFSLGSAAAVLEGQRPVAAMRRSWRLVAGSWWRTFGITVVAGLAASAAAQALQVPFEAVGLGILSPSAGADPHHPSAAVLAVGTAFLTLGGLLVLTITTPFTYIVTALLYVDLRIRREGLAFSLADAAGLTPR